MTGAPTVLPSCDSYLSSMPSPNTLESTHIRTVTVESVCLQSRSHVSSLSGSVFELLQSVVLEPEQGPGRLRLLAAAVLRELAPSTQQVFVRDFGPPVEERNVQYLLPVLLAQGNTQDRLSLLTASHIFR